jgi:hypothetical protein
MSRKRSDPAPGLTWGQKRRIEAEARMLAGIVHDAGGTLDDVLGDATIEEAATSIQVDPEDLRAAIETELAKPPTASH